VKLFYSCYGLIVGCLQQYHGVTISLRTLKRDIKQFGLRRHHEVTADVIDKADKAISSELQGPG
jgi:hypothetical protein